jgi:NAD-dependent dihydropyrimidine dehydrogenase PreA subunit
MTHQVYYFTGTGTSIGLIKELKSKGMEIEAFPIISPNCPKVIPKITETVGIIYPIHMNALPFVVQDFIRSLKSEGNPFIYVIATHGGIPGSAGANLVQVLSNSAIDINAYYEIETINNTPKGVAPKPLMQLDWEKNLSHEKLETMKTHVSSFISQVVLDIKDRKDNIEINLLPKSKGFIPGLMKLIWRLSKSKPQLEFFIDKEACTHCGICENICLTNRIELTDEGPKYISDHCYYCYACFNYCPTQAIYVKHYTKKEGRYHYPGINWQEISNQKSPI